MKNLLLCLNLAYGYAQPENWYFSDQMYPVLARISQHSYAHTECLIINDIHTSEDPEFAFLPPHMDTRISQQPVRDYKKYIDIPYQVSHKRHLNALHSEHNRGLIIDKFERISLCGFNLSTDVVPTALGLLDYHQNFEILSCCCGDVSKDLKQKAISYLRTLGINIK